MIAAIDSRTHPRLKDRALPSHSLQHEEVCFVGIFLEGVGVDAHGKVFDHMPQRTQLRPRLPQAQAPVVGHSS